MSKIVITREQDETVNVEGRYSSQVIFEILINFGGQTIFPPPRFVASFEEWDLKIGLAANHSKFY